MNDPVHINQLEVSAHIGVSDDERASAQRMAFYITFWPTQRAPKLEDDLSRTVDYFAVCAETKKFVLARADRLIETLADALASHLLEAFAIAKITIELRKFVLPDAQFVSVTVTRERSEV